MTDGPRWSRAALPWRTTLDGVIVATAPEETIIGGSAAAVWDVLDRPRTETQLVDECERAYGLDRATATEALAALAEVGLCRRT